MASQKIRIKLVSYDHEMVDQAAARIVDTMKKGGAKDQRTHPPAYGEGDRYDPPFPA